MCHAIQKFDDPQDFIHYYLIQTDFISQTYLDSIALTVKVCGDHSNKFRRCTIPLN